LLDVSTEHPTAETVDSCKTVTLLREHSHVGSAQTNKLVHWSGYGLDGPPKAERLQEALLKASDVVPEDHRLNDFSRQFLDPRDDLPLLGQRWQGNLHCQEAFFFETVSAGGSTTRTQSQRFKPTGLTTEVMVQVSDVHLNGIGYEARKLVRDI